MAGGAGAILGRSSGRSRILGDAEGSASTNCAKRIIELAEILLIDDVSVVRTVLCAFMSSAGHKVTECSDGKEAWPTLHQPTIDRRGFDLIVTDLWMSGGGGLEFIQRVRAFGIKTPIIAITSGGLYSRGEVTESVVLRAGADRLLIKPVPQTVLLDAITQLIAVPAR
jgi:CheY-like chemotaxis protein